MANFSSSAEDVINRKTDICTEPRDSVKEEKRLWQYYELERCIEFLKIHNRVALQFPDHLLPDSVNIATILRQKSGKEVFILGDTSYGSCCVDEIAAEHVASDAIIHFGSSCLSKTKRLPVLYVFGCEPIDTDDLIIQFQSLYPQSYSDAPILILFDVIYSHIIDILSERLRCEYNDLIISELLLPNNDSLHPDSSVTTSNSTTQCEQSSDNDGLHTDSPVTTSNSTTQCERSSDNDGLHPDSSVTTSNSTTQCERSSDNDGLHPDSPVTTSNSTTQCERSSDNHTVIYGRVLDTTRPLTDYRVLYIGTEGPTLTNFMLTLKSNEFHSYNPRSKTIRHETVSVNKMLGRRYFLVQKAKAAMTVGILVGTLGVEDYLPMIERLKKIMTSAGKKFYTVAVGKINPAKLANLMEIDIYVLVSCPECSLLNSQEFYKPIITPFEMEVACLSNRQWTGDMILDYRELLKDDVTITNNTDDEPEFSFISGRLMTKESGCGNDTPTNQTIVQRDNHKELVSQHTGVSYLQTRTWQGLEKKLGETSIVGVVEGLRGVPTHYTQ